jgi:hypothetical protein
MKVNATLNPFEKTKLYNLNATSKNTADIIDRVQQTLREYTKSAGSLVISLAEVFWSLDIVKQLTSVWRCGRRIA